MVKLRSRDALRVLLLALFAFSALLYALSMHGFAGDLLMDIANGRWILEHGYVPLRNVLTQAQAGVPWSNDEWLFGVFVAWVYAHLGAQGVLWSLGVVLAPTAFVVALLASRLRTPFDLAAVALVALGMQVTMSPRPQLFSYLFFAVSLWAVLEYRVGRRWPLWLAVALVPIWANLHSSSLLMPLLVLSEVLLGSRSLRVSSELLLAAGAGIVLSFAHPGGLTMGTGFISQILTSGIVDHIEEWLPTNPFSSWTWTLLLSLPIGAWLGWRAAKRGDLTLASWVIVGIVMVAFAVRFVPYALLGVLAVASAEPWLTARPTHEQGYRSKQLLVTSLVAVLAVFGFAMRPQFVNREPVAAITWLQVHHAQDVLTYYNFGDALDFYGVRSWVDGRAELWTNTAWWPTYINALFGQESPAAFAARYDPTARYMLWPAYRKVVADMRRSSSWRIVFKDRADAARTEYNGIGAVYVWQRTTTIK